MMYTFNGTFTSMKGHLFFGKPQVDYLTRVIAIIHATIVTVIAYYGCFYYCDDPKSSIFTDSHCRNSPKLIHVLSCIFTIGYLSFDFLMTLLFNHENHSLTFQTYAHHVAGILSFYAALVLRPHSSPFLMGAVANQFTEISTPFMNLRQLFFTHKLNDSPVALVNNLLFSVTFIFGRMVFQLCFICVIPSWILNEWRAHVHTDYTLYEQMGFYFCCFAQVLGLVLNSYWLTLVLKGLARLLKKGKAPQTKEEALKKAD